MRPALWLLLLSLLGAVPAAAQQPAVPQGPLTLLQAITLGRSQGVEAAIARLDVRVADARVGQRRADLLPTISGNAAHHPADAQPRRVRNPHRHRVTDPFDIYRLQLRASQTIFDASPDRPASGRAGHGGRGGARRPGDRRDRGRHRRPRLPSRAERA